MLKHISLWLAKIASDTLPKIYLLNIKLSLSQSLYFPYSYASKLQSTKINFGHN